MEYKSAVLSYKASRQEPILIVAAVQAVAQSTFAFGGTAAHSETQKTVGYVTWQPSFLRRRPSYLEQFASTF